MQDRKTNDARPAEQDKRRTEKKTAAAKQVFIDLDDAYGVPFSSRPVAVQTYGERGKKES